MHVSYITSSDVALRNVSLIIYDDNGTKKEAWRTDLLFIPLQEALALPNPVKMNNVRAHADMIRHTLYNIELHTLRV